MNQEVDKINHDLDPEETREWLESLQAVIEREGPERAHFLLEHLVDYTRRSGGHLPYDATTAYINTIPPEVFSLRPFARVGHGCRSSSRVMAISRRAGLTVSHFSDSQWTSNFTVRPGART